MSNYVVETKNGQKCGPYEEILECDSDYCIVETSMGEKLFVDFEVGEVRFPCDWERVLWSGKRSDGKKLFIVKWNAAKDDERIVWREAIYTEDGMKVFASENVYRIQRIKHLGQWLFFACNTNKLVDVITEMGEHLTFLV